MFQVAIPWFWENFDADKYSVWYGTYNYNDDLAAMNFMNVNLIGGKWPRKADSFIRIGSLEKGLVADHSPWFLFLLFLSFSQKAAMRY